jgi:signal transduction histidine kinase
MNGRSSIWRAPCAIRGLLRASFPKSHTIGIRLPERNASRTGSHGQISQLILTLCRNASDSLNGNPGRVKVELYRPTREEIAALAKFKPRPNSLMVGTVDASQDYACICVSDNGSGIPPDILKRIFDPFFTTKGRQRGTGLGLAVVHGVIEAHRAACRVESTPSEGTRFCIYLPVTNEALHLSAMSAAPANAARGVNAC